MRVIWDKKNFNVIKTTYRWAGLTSCVFIGWAPSMYIIPRLASCACLAVHEMYPIKCTIFAFADSISKICTCLVYYHPFYAYRTPERNKSHKSIHTRRKLSREWFFYRIFSTYTRDQRFSKKKRSLVLRIVFSSLGTSAPRYCALVMFWKIYFYQ